MARVSVDRLRIWRESLSLGWPIAVQQTFTTLMRTVDSIVTGLFSPVAVAAVGLAGFIWGDWAELAESMMAERADTDDPAQS